MIRTTSQTVTCYQEPSGCVWHDCVLPSVSAEVYNKLNKRDLHVVVMSQIVHGGFALTGNRLFFRLTPTTVFVMMTVNRQPATVSSNFDR